MLSLSNELARKSTWTCLSCSALTRTSQALIAGSPLRSAGRRHQRQHSSSKVLTSPKSAPKDEPKAIATPSEPPTKDIQAAAKAPAEKSSTTRVGKRKSKEAVAKSSDDAHFNLPSVPSTQHLHPLDVHIASFFSTHRPISVTTAIPPPTSSNSFSSLFDAKPVSKQKTSDVIYALSSAFNTLENAAAQQEQQMTPEEFDLRTAITQASSSNAEPTHNIDLPAKTLHINLQDLAKNFRPYMPPPPPIPLGAMQEAARKSSEEAKSEPAPKRKSYKTTITIWESTHANGRRTYETQSSPLIVEPPPTEEHMRRMPPAPRGQPFLGRMREKQIRYEDRLDERFGGEVWKAISVKRQRKLKMKKHKYKKLMKRTKNLRRRLDRT